MKPFSSAWVAMLIVSLVTSVVLLLIFRVSSNPKKIRRHRNHALAHVMEMAVYSDSPVASLGALSRVTSANVRYIAAFWIPFCLSLIPLVLITCQVHEWFAARPMRSGETATLTVRLTEGTSVEDYAIRVGSADSVFIESAGVRAPDRREISWRIRAVSAPGAVELVMPHGHLRKRIPIGDGLGRASQTRVQRGFLAQLLAPSEPPLSKQQPLESIKVTLPTAGLSLGGHECHWLVAFWGLVFCFSLILHKPFGVAL
jgi:hypothetical protein